MPKSSSLGAGFNFERVAPLLVAALALLIRTSSGPYPTDDAYITFRYARNLAAGVGMVYNPGQYVLGTSTPLYAFLLTFCSLLFGHELIPAYAIWINGIADAVAVVVLFGLARRLGMGVLGSAFCSLLLAVSPLNLRYSLGGMEVSLATALLLGAFSSHVVGERVRRDVLATAAIFVRLDAALAIVLFVAADLLRGRGIRWSSLAIPTVPLLAGMAVAGSVYGVPVPQTLVAKGAAIYQAFPQTNVFQFAHNFGGVILGPALGISARGNFLILGEQMSLLAWALFTPLSALWILGAVAAIRLEPDWAPFFAFPVGYAAVYSGLGFTGALVAEWYMVILIPFYLLGITFSIHRFMSLFGSGLWSAAAPAVFGLFVLAELAGLNLGRTDDRGYWVPRSVWLERELIYREVGKNLSTQVNENDVVAAPEIGSLGYYCDCTILDTVGLVSPQAVAYYPIAPQKVVAINAVPTGLIRDVSPEYLVSLEAFIRHTLLEDQWFLAHYEQLDNRETAAFGSRGLLVFRYRDPAPGN